MASRRKTAEADSEQSAESTGIMVGGVYAKDTGGVVVAGTLTVVVGAERMKLFVGKTQVPEASIAEWTHVDGGVDLAVVAKAVAP